MKALVLYQPWATLMAITVKRNETRGRPWSYHGDVAICAAKQKLGDDVPDSYRQALLQLWDHRSLVGIPAKDIQELYYALPFGAVVCVVQKTGCHRTESILMEHLSNGFNELECGDYGPNRFYYPTTNCRRLKTPVPVVGRQFVFDLPPDVEAKVLATLRAQ